MKKQQKRPLPTVAQTRILRRIAQNGGVMMLTHDDDNKDRYSDASGVTIQERAAKRFIANGWVEARRDSLFDMTPQTWRIKNGI